jgi:hypothetical protein
MIFEELAKLHSDEAIHKPGMVYEVWSDGEITLTKSGDLYGQRNLHCIEPGLVPEWIAKADADSYPKKAGNGFGYLAVETSEDAYKARDIIFQSFLDWKKSRESIT